MKANGDVSPIFLIPEVTNKKIKTQTEKNGSGFDCTCWSLHVYVPVGICMWSICSSSFVGFRKIFIIEKPLSFSTLYIFIFLLFFIISLISSARFFNTEKKSTPLNIFSVHNNNNNNSNPENKNGKST